MKGLILQMISFSTSMFFLAVALTLQEIDSFLIDFSAMPSGELMLFRLVFYGLFLAFLIGTLAVGDDI